VLGASLLGSPHCAGMCGGFVVFYSGQEEGARRVWPHAAYNAGRLLSYVALGAVAGAAGAGLDRLGAGAGLGRAAAVLAGALVLAWGVGALLAALGARVPAPAAPAALRRLVARALRSLHARPPAVRALALGLLSTLLPCGWLYAFVATAAGTGAPLAGALVMAAFWLGTVPVMAGVGLAAQGLFGPLRRRLPVVSASLLIVIGTLTLAGRLPASFATPPARPPGAAGATADCCSTAVERAGLAPRPDSAGPRAKAP
jgi:sulfite exporter TauE/SafE